MSFAHGFERRCTASHDRRSRHLSTRSNRSTLRSRNRRGLSLLEIVLALGLAAIAISILGQLVNIGNQAAVVARDQSRAQIIAQSIMSDYTSGVMGTADTLTSSAGFWPADETWSYQVDVVPSSSGTMNVITVTVQQADVTNPGFSITQWLAIPPEPEEETTTDTGAV